MEKKCDHCKKFKDEDQFNWKFKTIGVRHKTCRNCMHGFNKKYFEGPAKEKHLQQVKEKMPLALLQGNMSGNIFQPILVLSAVKMILWFWSFITVRKR